jgi:hypothetical protein
MLSVLSIPKFEHSIKMYALWETGEFFGSVPAKEG